MSCRRWAVLSLVESNNKLRFIVALGVLLAGCAPKVPVLDLQTWHLSANGKDLGVVQLPSHVDKRLPKDAQTFTLVTTLTLPATLHGDDVWLLIPYYEGQATLTIDGIGGSKALRGAGWRHHNTYHWHVPSTADPHAKRTFALEVQRTFLHAAWFDTRPMLVGGSDTAMTAAIRMFNEHLALVALGILAEISLAYWLLYAFRRDARYLWFAIEVTGANVYNLDLMGVNGRFFGAYDTALTALALSIAAIASVYFLHAHFALGRPSRGWRYLMAGATVTAAICARRQDTSLAWMVAAYLTPAVILTFWVCTGMLLRNRQRGDAAIILAAWTVLTCVTASEFWAWIGQGEVFGGIRLAGVGLGIFGLMLSSLLTINYGQSVQRTDALNEELIRQVKDRSRQLHNALALAGASHAAPIALEPGQVVQGRYRIVRNLGKGGMGAVYEVLRLSDGELLALKVARHVDGSALARLAREAELGAQIRHPNIVSLLDVDVADAGFIYIVMELINGPPLATCQGELSRSLGHCLLVLQKISQGLHALHLHGVIHRDLKPANVLTNYPWQDAPMIKIADFGISKLNNSNPGVLGMASLEDAYDGSHTMMSSGLSGGAVWPAPTPSSRDNSNNSSSSNSGHEILTEYAGLIGTPRYMAPELAHGSAFLSPAADIFSLGVIAYELLMQRYPFEVPPVLGASTGSPFILPPQLSSERLKAVHPDVLALLQRCLDSQAHARPTADELSTALNVEAQAMLSAV